MESTGGFICSDDGAFPLSWQSCDPDSFRGGLPVVNQTIPVVVTFHDTNAFTAEHMGDYLGLLVDEAVRLGLPLHHKPFLDNPEELLAAGLRRALSTVSVNCSTATLVEAQ